MKRPIIITLLSLILSCWAQAQYTITQTNYLNGAAKVDVISMFGSLPSSGYLPVTVKIQNNTGSDRVWSLDFTSTDSDGYAFFGSGRTENKLESNYQFQCSNGETKNFSILVPMVTKFPSRYSGYNESLSLELDLRSSGLEDEIDSMRSEVSEDWPAVLMSKGLHEKNGSQLDSYLDSKLSSSKSGSGRNIEFAGDFNPAEMPSDWRAYQGYSSVILTEGDWRGLAPAPRNALLEWTRLGGQLIVCSKNKSTNLNLLGIGTLSASKQTEKYSLGSVTVFSVGEDLSVNADELTEKIENQRPQLTFVEQISNDYKEPNWGLYQKLRGASFNATFLILIIFAFGILVGPVNLFVFAKSGRRHRLFITTPIIAVGTSLLLLVVIMIQDGFGGSGERAQLVEVRADNGEYKAYVKQQQFCRTGILMDGSFETSTNSFISSVPIDSSRLSRVTLDNGGGSGKYRIQQGEEGTLGEGDWFQSRSQLGHYVSAVMPTRGRIAVSGEKEDPKLHSSFDFTIENLLYRDNQGIWWCCRSEVAPGSEVRLKEISNDQAETIAREGARFHSSELGKNLLTKLMPRNGHFVAITKDAPGIETHSSITWEQTHSIFTGPVVTE